jgi:hypothetical protein
MLHKVGESYGGVRKSAACTLIISKYLVTYYWFTYSQYSSSHSAFYIYLQFNYRYSCTKDKNKYLLKKPPGPRVVLLESPLMTYIASRYRF